MTHGWPEEARYASMRWNTPLSEQHASVLIERLAVEAADSVLDLGCGWGELLTRIVAAGARRCTGVGVDTDAHLLERGRALARSRGLAGRVTFVDASAPEWTERAERVVCVGASHAWAGTEAALAALAPMTSPGGRVLFGDGCWEREPTAAALEIFGEKVLPLADIVGLAQEGGWRVLHLSTADQREWDEFESTWRLGRESWVLANPGDAAASAMRRELNERLVEYVAGYRGILGFCYLILSRQCTPPS